MKMEQSVPKRRHIKFRRRGIAQKKAYNKALLLLETSGATRARTRYRVPEDLNIQQNRRDKLGYYLIFNG